MEQKFETVNRVAIYDRLQELANDYLKELDESNILLFANQAKAMLDDEFDEFVIAQERIYTEDPIRAIKDKTAMLDFTDIQSGYRRQMQTWVNNHPVVVNSQRISVDDLPNFLPFQKRKAFRRSVSTLGIGTLLVVGLRALTHTDWIYLGELLVLALTGQQYMEGRKADDKTIRELQKKWYDSYKNRIVESIRRDLDGWLERAEQESARILKLYNL